MSEPRIWDYPIGSLPPRCPHGISYAQPCYGCGWVCPTCRRSYAPWVRECNYRHEAGREVPGMTALPSLAIMLPSEFAGPGYQQVSKVSRSWREIVPGLQCCVQNPVPDEDGNVTICLRLAPPGDAP